MEKLKISDAEINSRAEAAYRNNYILTHNACIDMTGDLIAGMLLDRIMYWFSAGEDGKRRVRVVRDGYYWLVKQRTDWYDEIRISPKQYDRAAKILAEKGLIHTAKYRFNGVIQIHIRPDYEVYQSLAEEWKRNEAERIKREMDEENEKITAYNETVPLLPEDDYEDYRGAMNDEYDKYKESFEVLWEQYPKKIGKQEAYRAYADDKKANNTDDGVILKAIAAYKQYIKNIEYRYIRNGGTWFKRHSWNDEYNTEKCGKTEVFEHSYDYKNLKGENGRQKR